MSARNGDKSRHNRQRKQRIRQRMRDRVLFAGSKKSAGSKAKAGKSA